MMKLSESQCQQRVPANNLKSGKRQLSVIDKVATMLANQCLISDLNKQFVSMYLVQEFLNDRTVLWQYKQKFMESCLLFETFLQLTDWVLISVYNIHNAAHRRDILLQTKVAKVDFESNKLLYDAR